MNETISVIEKMIKSRKQQLASCERMIELLEPEWKRFEAREAHDLYVSRDYADHTSAARTHRKEIAALEEMLTRHRAQEHGQWSLVSHEDRVSLQSDDFSHDVRLYVNGDFRDRGQEILFAEGVQKVLNTDLDALRKYIDGLEKAINLYGDRIAMANAPAELQEVIDQAFDRKK